jgi:hypothetical protein
MLIDADLNSADFSHVDLVTANLRYANLLNANLGGANLGGADLSRAVFTRTVLFHTLFVDVDLSECIDLEKMEHMSSSSIGIDTIYRSRGTMPHAFLKGSGSRTSGMTSSSATEKSDHPEEVEQ